jgi:hypothetical protein
MTNSLKAGFFYFLGVFALGFVLGVLRTLFLAPYTGPVIAVLAEIPFMLLFAWYLCRMLVERLAIPPDISMRLVMGFVAFACLMTGELLTAIQLQDGRVADIFRMFDLPENRIGLAGQIAFALFPLIQGYSEVRVRREP